MKKSLLSRLLRILLSILATGFVVHVIRQIILGNTYATGVGAITIIVNTLCLYAMFFIAPFIAPWITKKQEENMTEDNFSVRKPMVELFIRVLLVIFGVSSIILMSVVPTEGGFIVWLLMYILISSGTLMFVYQALKYILWKVEIRNHKLYYRKILKTEIFPIEEIIEIKKYPSGNLSIWFSRQKPLFIDSNSSGHGVFTTVLEKEGIQFVEIAALKDEITQSGYGDESDMNTKHDFKIRKPKINAVVGIGSTIFWGAILILLATILNNETATLSVYLVFSPAFALGLFLAIYGIRWKVEVYGDEITFRPAFGRTRVFSVDAIDTIKIEAPRYIFYGKSVKIYSRGKKIMSLKEIKRKDSEMFISYLSQKRNELF